MDALGWQIGAVLFGVSFLIIAIYLAKLINSTTKVVEKAYKIVDYNERHIHETIENVAAITKRSRNWILNEAITNYISYNNYFLNEVEKGLQDADNKNFATPEEVDNIFKKYGAR